jgi:uncharacterized protein YrrD
MLHRAAELRRFSLRSDDAVLGTIEDLYLDDRFWTVRYLVVDTAGWLVQQRVLVSPRAIVAVDADNEAIDTELTMDQVAASPTPDEHAPVSRQFEIAYHKYFDYSPYWIGPLAWGANSAPRPPEDAAPLEEDEQWDSHLYSAKEIAGFDGYKVVATDGEAGHVADLIVADKDYVVRYLVVDTRAWLPGKHVLVPPQWTDVDWENRTISVDLARDAIMSAPAYEADVPIDRDYETRLFDHYCRQAYWTDDSHCYEAPAT